MNLYLFRALGLVLVAVYGVQGAAEIEKPKSKEKFEYPKICGWKGKPKIVSPGFGGKAFGAKSILKDRGTLITGPEDRICIELGKLQYLIVESASKVEVTMEEDSEKVNDVNLEYGEISIQANQNLNFQVRTPVYVSRIPKGGVARLFYKAQVGLGGVEAHLGDMSFQPLENEITTSLAAGESVGFQAELLRGEIQFDSLLAGKKVVRGTLQPVVKLEVKELEKLKAGLLSFFPQHRAGGKNTKSEARKTLCLKPPGDLNQCWYRCVNNPKQAKNCMVEKPNVRCEYLRCNAEGEWADPIQLGKLRAECGARDHVSSCP